MNLNTIWSTLTESLEPLGNSAMESTASDLGLEPGWQTLAWAIILFESEPFTTESYMRLRPYGSASVNESRFASAAKEGILTSISKGEYVTKEKGKSLISQIFQAADASIARLQPIPPAELKKILNYTKQLLEASLAMPEPLPKLVLTRYYKNLHPGRDAQALRLIVHYIGSLDQYRGTAHLAAWEGYNLEGYAWSLLTSIWRGEANTLEALHEQVGTSAFSQDEVMAALRDLVSRGWVKNEDGGYYLTPEGATLRQDAEDLTDRLFFQPWDCLNESEQEDLSSLAIQLRDGLKKLQEEGSTGQA